jgi:hypothetical protein
MDMSIKWCLFLALWLGGCVEVAELGCTDDAYCVGKFGGSFNCVQREGPQFEYVICARRCRSNTECVRALQDKNAVCFEKVCTTDPEGYGLIELVED